MRGAAWLWPAFAAAVLVDAVILHFLPPVGTDQQINAPRPLNLLGNLILASFVNLFLVGIVAPWFARRLAARPAADDEPAPPYEVMLGRTAAVMMAVTALGLAVAGLGNRPVIVSDTQQTEAAARTLRAWVNLHGTADQQEKVAAGIANTVRLAPGFFRSCIPTKDFHRSTCFFIDAKKDPPTIKRDPDMRNNVVQQ
jgi:hypothetical protein